MKEGGRREQDRTLADRLSPYSNIWKWDLTLLDCNALFMCNALSHIRTKLYIPPHWPTSSNIVDSGLGYSLVFQCGGSQHTSTVLASPSPSDLLIPFE